MNWGEERKKKGEALQGTRSELADGEGLKKPVKKEGPERDARTITSRTRYKGEDSIEQLTSDRSQRRLGGEV